MHPLRHYVLLYFFLWYHLSCVPAVHLVLWLLHQCERNGCHSYIGASKMLDKNISDSQILYLHKQNMGIS